MTPNPTDQTEYLMSPSEVAEFLGVGRTFAYEILRRGEIPAARISKKALRVRRSDVDKFLNDRLIASEKA